MDEAIRYVENISASQPGFLDQLRSDVRATAVWLPQSWAARAHLLDECSRFLSGRSLRRIHRAAAEGSPLRTLRAGYAAAERAALWVAAQRLGLAVGRNAGDLSLWYTPLGGPKVAWRGAVAASARESGLRLRDVHVSFTHDGDAFIAFLAHAPGLRGLGVDAVYLPRLGRRDRSYLVRFGSHFMSEKEHESFSQAISDEDREAAVIRTAAHFSLMEAASKACGTGLLLGGGIGRPTSLPPKTLNVDSLSTPVRFELGGPARARIGGLGASRLEGYWSVDSEYLVSAALLF